MKMPEMHMAWQPDLDEIRSLVREGWIREAIHPNGRFSIFNYTEKAQYDKHWNPCTLNCRGLVTDQVGNVVARPFKKFFNYGEQMPTPGTKIVEVTEKVDGSLGLLFQGDDGWEICTRGSFVSEQAKWATDHFNTYYRLYRDDGLTLMFEIVYPENRVVVDYKGFEGLILIGARDRLSGRDLYAKELDEISEAYGFMRPVTYQIYDINLLLDMAQELSADAEGWVLRYSDDERLKIKGNYTYLRIV